MGSDIQDIYSRAADDIVIFHFFLVAGIILYQLILPIGLWFQARWARNFWIRVLHLSIMGYIGIEGAIGQECPLTVWERGLRIADMDETTRNRYYAWEYDPMDARPPLARFSHRALLYRLEEGAFQSLHLTNESFFHLIHILFGAIVLFSWILGPPELPWSRKKREAIPAKPTANPP